MSLYPDRTFSAFMSYVEPTTKLKLKNPLIEHALLQKSLKARSVKSLRVLSSGSGALSTGSEVDTCGCLVSKTEKKTARGDSFSVWRLSDLETMQSSCTLFLFREAHEAHCRIDLGTVLLILGSSAMEQSSDRGSNDSNASVSVSVNEGWQAVRLVSSFVICILLVLVFLHRQ